MTTDHGCEGSNPSGRATYFEGLMEGLNQALEISKALSNGMKKEEIEYLYGCRIKTIDDT